MVREKMAEKLRAYKAAREEERRANVVELEKRRFKDATDEVRLEDSKLFQQKCVFDQQQRMLEKQAQRERETMEEFLYAELWKRDMDIKIARERTEAENKRKAVQEKQAVLDWQTRRAQDQRDAEKRQLQQEAAMLDEQWRAEDDNERAKDQARKMVQQARAGEIKMYNESIIRLRKEEEERERIQDKVRLGDVLAREQEIRDAEEAEKLKVRAEATQI